MTRAIISLLTCSDSCRCRHKSLKADSGIDERWQKPERWIMNTQQLQDYMASSLYGLARVCGQIRKLRIRINSCFVFFQKKGLDMESLLIRIEEINEEKKKICLEDCCLEPAINLNQLYSFQQNQTAQQTRLWSGLKKLQSIWQACMIIQMITRMRWSLFTALFRAWDNPMTFPEL